MEDILYETYITLTVISTYMYTRPQIYINFSIHRQDRELLALLNLPFPSGAQCEWPGFLCQIWRQELA